MWLARNSIPRDQILGVIAANHLPSNDPEELIEELPEIASRLRALRDNPFSAPVLTDADPEIQQLYALQEGAMAQGAVDVAKSVWAEISDKATQELEALDRRAAELHR